ncbi:MAG: TIGR00374 family protein, partial [Deltaproteobacteria bacterium]|nr:TIGR00374 family protein [Deltaproteobacteria bacterium]
MKKTAYILFAAGLALFTTLLAYNGLGDISSALKVAGWGLIWVTLFHIMPLIIDAVAWRYLFPVDACPPFLAMIRARWMGEAINGLLPV